MFRQVTYFEIGQKSYSYLLFRGLMLMVSSQSSETYEPLNAKFNISKQVQGICNRGEDFIASDGRLCLDS